MNNKALLFLIVILNVVMIFLLVHKQNKIIKALYELQRIEEQKEILLQQKKELTLAKEQGQQLSSVQSFAQNTLAMHAMKIKDAHTIPLATEPSTMEPSTIEPLKVVQS